MPLVAHNDLPSFERLRTEGIAVLPPERARHQHIREIHIGLLNMMPDKALAATERQFFRLIGESNPIAQFYVHPFTLPELARGSDAQAYIDNYYESFDNIQAQGLDALIVTGANVQGSDLHNQDFWDPLIKVIDWAWENVTSTLCSCLTTHAVMQFRYQQNRLLQADKIWGVFSHKVTDKRHPLVSDVNSRFDVPHSRWNNISREQFMAAGLRVLVESEDAGVHLATSADGLRFVMFQGHPEYDTISLLKEYKREALRFHSGELSVCPPFPDNYLAAREQAILEEFQERSLSDFPEELIAAQLDNTWHDSAKAVVGNWIGLVYQVTHRDRNRPFMDGIDPNDPLRLKL